MASRSEIERLLLTSEGRSSLAEMANKVLADAPSEDAPAAPMRFEGYSGAKRIREATSDELRHARARTAPPLTDVLEAPSSPAAGDNPALSLWALAFEHPAYQGRSAFMTFPREAIPKTYLPIPDDWLKLASVRLHDATSSIQLTASPEEYESTLYLFEHADYRGGYQAIYVEPGATTSVPDLREWGFNDVTSSLMFIRGFKNQFIPLSVGSFIRPHIARLFDSTNRVRPRGSAVVTWDMWPSFAPTQEFVLIRIPLTVVVDNWFDYDAELKYWCYFFVGADERAYAGVYNFDMSVSDGIISGSIRDRLQPFLLQGAIIMSQYLGGALGALESLSVERIVLRPGNPYAFAGDVDDDVGLVIVLKDDDPGPDDWRDLPGRLGIPVRDVFTEGA